MYSNDEDGRRLEIAYVKLFAFFHAILSGGFTDGGRDVVLEHPEIKCFQVKSSIHFALEHIQRGIDFGNYIPVVIGDYLTDDVDEVADAITMDGFYLAPDLDNSRNRVVMEKAMAFIPKASMPVYLR